MKSFVSFWKGRSVALKFESQVCCPHNGYFLRLSTQNQFCHKIRSLVIYTLGNINCTIIIKIKKRYIFGRIVDFPNQSIILPHVPFWVLSTTTQFSSSGSPSFPCYGPLKFRKYQCCNTNQDNISLKNEILVGNCPQTGNLRLSAIDKLQHRLRDQILFSKQSFIGFCDRGHQSFALIFYIFLQSRLKGTSGTIFRSISEGPLNFIH